MCVPGLDPVTATLIASTVASGVSQNQQAQFQSDSLQYQARVEENAATRTRNVGIEEENRHREEVAQLIGRQRARMAASGIRIDQGTSLDLQEDASILGEADAMRIRRNFTDRADVLDQQSSLSRFEAGATRQAGRNALAGSLLTAGGQFVGSGVADKWFNNKSAARVGLPLGDGSAFRGFA